MASNPPKLVPVRGNDSTRIITASLKRPEEKFCVNCRAGDQIAAPLMLCGQCRGAWYCSDNCARQNAGRHRKLCYKYRMALAHKTQDTVRAVEFPVDKPKPEILWVHTNNWATSVDNRVSVGSQPADSPLITFTVDHNYLTGRRLPFDLKVRFPAADSPLTGSLFNCYNESWELPSPSFPWAGTIVVVRVARGTDVAEDITMADFRDVLDFFAWYGHHFAREPSSAYRYRYGDLPGAPALSAVLIRCAATEEALPLRPEQGAAGALVPILIDHLHPVRGLHTPDNAKSGVLSNLSVHLGTPLRLYFVPRPPLETNKRRWDILPGDKSNFWASELLIDLTPDNNDNNNITLPNVTGDVLVVRDDDRDLTVDEVAAMCLEARRLRQSAGSITNNSSYQAAVGNQRAAPVVLSNVHPEQGIVRAAGGPAARGGGADVWDLPIDPVLLGWSSSSSPSAAAAAAAANAPVAAAARVRPGNDVPLRDQTLPALWTRVQARDGRVLFEGFPFAAPARGVRGGGEGDDRDRDSDDDGDVMMEDVDGEEVEEGEMESEYPEPPPMRYNYSMVVIPEEEMRMPFAMEE